MSILYLTYDGINDNLGKSQIIPYINGLTEKGWGITVISFEKDVSSLNSNTSEIDRRIKWYPLKYHNKPYVLSSLYDILACHRIANRIVVENDIQVVHCRSYIPALIGLFLKKKYGIKFIFDMRGFWADERVEGKIWNRSNPLINNIYKYFKRKEKQFIKEADCIVSLTENAKVEIQSTYNSHGDIQVIPTCVDINLFNPDKIGSETSSKLKKELGITEDEYVMLYLGSVSTWYLSEELFLFFFYFQQKVPRSRLLIVSSESKERIYTIWQRASLRSKKMQVSSFEESIIVTNVDRFLVPAYISICDLSVFFIKNTYSKKASSATKMGEIMSMGKPMVTNRNWGDVDKEFESTIGHQMDGFKDIDFENAIGTVLEQDFDPVQIREKALSYLDLKHGINAYNNIYERLA